MEESRKNRYLDKLNKLDSYIENLSLWLMKHPYNESDQKPDLHWIYAIIHVFQNTAEVLADLCAMILKDQQIPVKDNYSNFHLLFTNKIISEKTHENLKKINGLRNRIAHEYNGLNYYIAWEAMNEFLEEIEQIQSEVKKWLKKH